MPTNTETKWNNENQIARLVAMLPNEKFNRLDMRFESDGSVSVSLLGPKFETGEMMPAVAVKLLQMEGGGK